MNAVRIVIALGAAPQLGQPVLIKKHPPPLLALHDFHARQLRTRNQNQIGRSNLQHTLRIDLSGFLISITLLRIMLPHEKIEVGVEHRLRITRATTSVDLNQDSRVLSASWSERAERVLCPV